MDQIQITFPDGSAKECAAGITPREIAEGIGKRLAKAALAAKVNDQVVDLDRPIRENAAVEILTFESEDGKTVFRHSASHVMAMAVKEIFPKAQLTIGPPIEGGFYYDFDVEPGFTEEDIAKIQERAEEIVKRDVPFVREECPKSDAVNLFRECGENYKLELLEDLQDGEISLYRNADFVDLCRGPHLPGTGYVKAIKILSAAGAYWRGDERNKMLQRLYGTAFPSQKELKGHLDRLEEAAKRDHRKLGKELGLFHMDPTAPGMPYWLPKGLKILRELIDFWRVEHEKRDYQEIASPLINKKSLWERSGHWDHFKDNMFIIPISEHVTYAVKPMNCPNAMVVYNLKVRSYRDLPLRLSDCDTLHRNEPAGSLHGLFRVQSFQQDDAHIFITEDQIEDEYERILEIADLFYKIFDMKYSLRMGTRPEEFMGDPETWDKAEAALKRILDKHSGVGNYEIAEGDGAFYGPKIDIIMEDALQREWQMGTIQLDFQLPRRFDCVYVDQDGSRKTPVVIHRVIYGSLERFVGILIEHTGGAFPVWLAPVQTLVLPIGQDHIATAKECRDQLRQEGIRAELDGRDEKIGYRIREAQVQQVPYMLVIGNREAESGTVAVRHRREGDLGAMSRDEFTERITEEIRTKKLN